MTIKGEAEFYSGAKDIFPGTTGPDGPVMGDVQQIDDWFYILDTPGYAKALLGDPVKTADLTFSFVVGILDLFGTGGCTTRFTLRLRVTDGVEKWDPPIVF